MSPPVVLNLDPGLATFGLSAVATDGNEHFCVAADVFTSSPSRRRVTFADDHVRRVCELTRFLDRYIEQFKPAAIAAEAMSFPRSRNAVICISLSWGVICAACERWKLPLVSAGPNEVRRAITSDGEEESAHRQAIRTVPSFADRARRIDRDLMVHALDSLVVFCWSLQTNIVRAAVMGRMR